MVTRRTEHNTEEEHFSTRDRLGEKLTLFFLQSEEKERGKKNRLQSFVGLGSFNRDPTKKGKGSSKRQRSPPQIHR